MKNRNVSFHSAVVTSNLVYFLFLFRLSSQVVLYFHFPFSSYFALICQNSNSSKLTLKSIQFVDITCFSLVLWYTGLCYFVADKFSTIYLWLIKDTLHEIFWSETQQIEHLFEEQNKSFQKNTCVLLYLIPSAKKLSSKLYDFQKWEIDSFHSKCNCAFNWQAFSKI